MEGSINPYDMYEHATTFGLLLASGKPGDDASDATAALAIVNNTGGVTNSGGGSSGHFTKGIVFGATSLVGANGLAGTGIAMSMAKGHEVEWQFAGGTRGAVIRSDVSTNAGRKSLIFDDSGFGVINLDTSSVMMYLSNSGTLFTSAPLYALSNTALPAGGSIGLGLRFFSTANFGVFAGSGAPTLSAAKGSLYLRSDGSGANDRVYINTKGSTGWTYLTSGA